MTPPPLVSLRGAFSRCKPVAWITAPFFVGALVAIGSQVEPLLAYLRLRDLDWLQAASPSELRATAHLALAFRLGNPHDAFITLMTHADGTSVDVLREALSHEPQHEGEGAECTWNHGRLALEHALEVAH